NQRRPLPLQLRRFSCCHLSTSLLLLYFSTRRAVDPVFNAEQASDVPFTHLNPCGAEDPGVAALRPMRPKGGDPARRARLRRRRNRQGLRPAWAPVRATGMPASGAVPDVTPRAWRGVTRVRTRSEAKASPPVVRERLVRLGHLLHIVLAL